MTASRLRRVGNLGVVIDPGAVVAVYALDKPPRVRVVTSSGHALDVVHIGRIEGRGQDGATAEDVEKVWHQLTGQPTARAGGG